MWTLLGVIPNWLKKFVLTDLKSVFEADCSGTISDSLDIPDEASALTVGNLGELTMTSQSSRPIVQEHCPIR